MSKHHPHPKNNQPPHDAMYDSVAHENTPHPKEEPMSESLDSEREAVETTAEESGITEKSALSPLETLENALLDVKSENLRLRAELQTQTRRHAESLQKERLYAPTAVVKDLIPVIDNLESAVQHMPALDSDDRSAWEKWHEGLVLSLRSLEDTLTKHHLSPIEAKGRPFDPTYHEAMTSIESPEVKVENEVLEVIQKGYQLHDRVVRPARVVVGRKPKADESK